MLIQDLGLLAQSKGVYMVEVQRTEHLQSPRIKGRTVLLVGVGLLAVWSIVTLGGAKLIGDITEQTTMSVWMPFGPILIAALWLASVMVIVLAHIAVKGILEQVPLHK